MGAAPLPGRAVEHAGDGVGEPLMGVADDELDAGKAAGDQPLQEAGPGRAVLGCAQLQAEDLAVAVGVDPVATRAAVLTTRPASRTLMTSASSHTNTCGPASNGRLRHAATSSSSSPQTRETWDLDRLVMPMAWAMSSTRRVETPST